LSLYLIKHHAIKTNGGVEVYINAFLTPTLHEGKWSGSIPGRFTLGERAPGTNWLGHWVDLRDGLQAVGGR
jgi:hypothetical protein